MRVLLHVALATSVMFLGGVATAQEDRVETRAERATAEVIAGLNKFAADPVAVDQAVARAWPMFNDEQRKAYGEHLSWTIQNKAINAHFAGLAKSAVDADFTREQLKMFFMQSATDLQAKGVRRLDDEGIAFYVGSMRRMIEFLPPELCKAALTGQLTTRQTAFMEQKWLSSLDMPQFNAVLDFYKRTMVAEATKSPSVRTITDEQLELVKKALGNAFKERVDNAPEGRLALAGALLQMKDADPRLVCRASGIAIDAHLDLAEPLRSWALVKFAGDVAR